MAQSVFRLAADSPFAKYLAAPGFIQSRRSEISTWLVFKRAVSGNSSFRLCEGLVRIRCEAGNVDKAGDAVIDPRGRDERSSIGVADKEDGTWDTAECASDGCNVARERVEPKLRSENIEPSSWSAGIILLKHDASAQMS